MTHWKKTKKTNRSSNKPLQRPKNLRKRQKLMRNLTKNKLLRMSKRLHLHHSKAPRMPPNLSLKIRDAKGKERSKTNYRNSSRKLQIRVQLSKSHQIAQWSSQKRRRRKRQWQFQQRSRTLQPISQAKMEKSSPRTSTCSLNRSRRTKVRKAGKKSPGHLSTTTKMMTTILTIQIAKTRRKTLKMSVKN